MQIRNEELRIHLFQINVLQPKKKKKILLDDRKTFLKSLYCQLSYGYSLFLFWERTSPTGDSANSCSNWGFLCWGVAAVADKILWNSAPMSITAWTSFPISGRASFRPTWWIIEEKASQSLTLGETLVLEEAELCCEIRGSFFAPSLSSVRFR